MHWGLEHNASHYLDLCSAMLGLSLFPIAYVGYAVRSRLS
jgi:hypothetical protein